MSEDRTLPECILSLAPLREPGKKPVEAVFEATEAECAVLAERFGLEGLSEFHVDVTVRQGAVNGHYLFAGHVTAKPVQKCVVTLEPVETDVDQEFSLVLVPETDADAADEESEDDIEYYSDDEIDIAELGAIELALNLEPYPRKPGASLAGESLQGGKIVVQSEEQNREAEKSEKPSPFAALAELRQKK